MDKPKIILFDIDHTLFNTPILKKMINNKIKSKVDSKRFRNINEIIDNVLFKSSEETGYFNPKHFIARINTELKLNLPLGFINESLDYDSLHKNYYKDVKEVLVKLSTENNLSVGIFSGGDIAFQKSKIKFIKHLLHKSHIHIFLKKELEVKKIINRYRDHKLFIVDDWLSILEKSKKINENITTIWIKRKNNEFKEKKKTKFSPDYVLSDLRRVISIVKNN